VSIRLSPRARTDRLVAIAASASGGHVLKAAVAAPAEGGRANEALLQLLAQVWRLPRRDLSIVAGSTSRNKVVRVAGDPQRLVEQVAPEIARLPSG
jgi:hypothetical protein